LPKNVKHITYEYNSIILHVILYGCETFSLALREENRLKLFENRVLRRRSGPKIIGGWRKQHNELHNLYSSPNIIRMIKPRGMGWAGHVPNTGRS
jgi:hypothetical protein